MSSGITRAAPDRIEPVPRGGARLPVSAAQQALHFVEQLYPGTSMNHVAVAVRVDGPLDLGRLREALGAVLRRHEALRTSFPLDPDRPGQPYQRISEPVVDLAFTADVRAAVEEPFDLAYGPLVRTRVRRRGPQEHVVVVVMHQLVSDGPSLQLFFDDLAAAYAGSPLPAPAPVQFADFAAWERRQPAPDLAWWRAALAGAPVTLRLPLDRARPSMVTGAGANHQLRLAATTTARVRRLAARLRVTPFAVMLAAYGLLLAEWTGQHDLLVAVPVNGRTRTELEPVIGFFVHTLPVRITVAPGAGLADLAPRVSDRVLDAVTHQVPFERLVAEHGGPRDPGTTPLVQTFFSYESDPVARPRFAGCAAALVDCPPDGAKVDLDVTVFGESLTVTYRPELFDPASVRALAGRYEQVLACAPC